MTIRTKQDIRADLQRARDRLQRFMQELADADSEDLLGHTFKHTKADVTYKVTEVDRNGLFTRGVQTSESGLTVKELRRDWEKVKDAS